jgi:L-fucose isomerase-like protein
MAAANKYDNNSAELKQRVEEIKAYARVPEKFAEKLKVQAKFGLAVEAWIKENEVDATAIQCWDSLEKNYGCAACVSMSMMSEKLIPSACETDIAGAISMYMLTLASGQPAALADWNNNFAREHDKCVCTHCGNFPKSFVKNPLELGTLGVLGSVLGSEATFGAVKGKVSAGDFSFFRISTDDNFGLIKAYLGEGEITDEPYGMDGCIAVTKVNNLQQLMRFICKNGFEHHVAMCRSRVADILEEAIDTYLGWDLYRHR